LIFGVMRFHLYLYGRQFLLLTDHRPLVTILGPSIVDRHSTDCSYAHAALG
jgi:hypothetical protein